MKKNHKWIVLFIGIALMVGITDYFTQAKYTVTSETVIPKVVSEEGLQLLDYTIVNDAEIQRGQLVE
ncbi:MULTISPECIES: hypothetical protein [Paenibacillus]|uniref:hypothetical protein n=1 Tax=Paenibacillus TaxID=44249 RepID=UPI0004962872|nr:MULTISPECIES: hypothetical protein [Paenibacillus]UMY54742.1 hypothetical protein MLD56_24975 [Paenibacillus peoriae]